MMDMVERVARAIGEHTAGAKWTPEGLARTAIEASGLSTLESALRTIQSAIPGYLKKEMTAEEFALEVIGAVDNGKVNKALEAGR